MICISITCKCTSMGSFLIFPAVFKTYEKHLTHFNFIEVLKRLLLFLKLFIDMIIICILCTPQPTYQSTYRPTVDRHISRHIGRVSSVGQYVDRDVSLDISADISVEHRSICRLTHDRYVGWYLDREWLSDCRPTCRLIGYQHSADTSLLLAYWWL